MQQWFRSLARGLAVVLVGVCCHTSAYANECNTSGDGVGGRDAFSSTNCDTNYRDEPLSCENERGVWGACPPKNIPHKRTAPLTFKDLSPYLWYSLPHPSRQLHKYDGPLYRGSQGDSRLVNSMIGEGDPTTDPKGTKNRFAACIHQIEMRNGGGDLSVREKAALIRLQLDNCANQYILNAALEPTRKEDTRLMVSRDRCKAPERLNAKMACQPLHIEQSGLKNEYSVTPYLESAWGRMLQHVKESDAVATPENVRDGVSKYKGYMRRKRGFGPFDGILGAIFNLVNTFSELMSTISNLGNMANFNMQMPNIQQAMGAFQNGFSQLGTQFTNQFSQFPGQIMSSFTNMQNTFSQLGNNFNFTNQFGQFTQGFSEMSGRLQGLSNLPGNMSSAFGGLTNTMNNLPNIAGMMQNMPQSLGNLQQMIPNISSIPGQIGNIQNIAGNMGGSFGGSLNAMSNLPGGVTNTFRNGISNASQSLSGIPNIIGNMATNTSAVLVNPGDQITNQINGQAGQLNSINDSLARGGSLTQVSGNLRDAAGVVRGIPNVDLVTGGVIGISTDIGSMNALNNVLNGGTLNAALDPSVLQSLSQISNSMQDMFRLESALNQMRNQMISGQVFDGVSKQDVDRYLNNVTSYNNLMRGMNIGQISNLMNGMGNIRNVFNTNQFGNFGNLANMDNYMNSMARNMQGLTNMNAYSNILGSMQSNVMGALGFSANFNFNSMGSPARKMNARKDSDVHPRMPEGSIIRNPLPTPKNMPDIKLTQLAAFPYEEITDPTHPFSPRWHYYVNDREGYSPWAEKYTKENEGDKKYQENSVFCAGERLEDPNTKQKEIVKVDVLEFRRKKFEVGENQLYDGIYNRMFFNQYCFKNEGAQEDPCKIKITVWGYTYEKDLPCFTCFNLKKGKRTNTPPCATSHSGKDRKIIMSPIKGAIGDAIAIITSIPGISSIFEFRVIANDIYMNPGTANISGVPVPIVGLYAGAVAGGGMPSPLCLVAKLGCPAACSVPNIYRKSSIKKLCRDLRAPYTPLNKLKMRYGLREDDIKTLQEEEQDQGNNAQQPKLVNELPDGVGDGLQHEDHFTNHMPYPRLWDTGKSVQLTPSNQQDPRDQNGRFTSIVGVGRETIIEAEQQSQGGQQGGGQQQQQVESRGVKCSEHPEACKAERCMIGGWGQDINIAGLDIKRHDPVSSWTELKLYQARTLRDYGVNCLGRYERLFKPGAQEDHILALAGGTYMERSDSCEIEAGNVGNDNKKFNILYRNFPKAWRGYAADPGNDGKDAFPKFPNGSESQISTGLDDAKEGDVIIMPNGTAKGTTEKGLPILSYITVTNLGSNCEDRSGCSVTVLERNFSKWPDACGSTDSWGIESSRTMYRPGTMPNSIKKRIRDIDPTGNISCQDNDLQHCELDNWSSVKLYHIRKEDARGGNLNPIESSTP